MNIMIRSKFEIASLRYSSQTAGLTSIIESNQLGDLEVFFYPTTTLMCSAGANHQRASQQIIS